MSERKKKSLPEARLRDVRMLFRNFAGLEKKFNAAGKRNFSIVLSPEQYEAMKRDGWNVKMRPGRTEDEDTLLHIKANINYKSDYPPAIWLVTSRGRTLLGPDTVGMLDIAEIKKVDVLLSAYFFDEDTELPAAYVKTLYVTIVEDELDLAYADLKDLGEPDKDPTPPWEE